MVGAFIMKMQIITIIKTSQNMTIVREPLAFELLTAFRLATKI